MSVYEDIGFVLKDIGLRFRGSAVFLRSALNGTGF